MPDEKLEFSAQDLGRLVAHVALSGKPAILATRDWLALHASRDLVEYKLVLDRYAEGFSEGIIAALVP